MLRETDVVMDSKLELDECASDALVVVGATNTADVLSELVIGKTDVLVDSNWLGLSDCTSDALSVHAHVELVSVQKLVQTSNSRMA